MNDVIELIAMMKNPYFTFTFFLLTAVVFVNGLTDATNAVATAIGTNAMRHRHATMLSAAMNFCGLIITCAMRPRVAESVMSMLDFSATKNDAVIALCAALLSVFVWSVVAWYFGIPTSESHALTAGLTGAAVALQRSFAAINKNEWLLVVWGLFLSTAIGFLCAYAIEQVLRRLKLKTSGIKCSQIMSTALLSFMHGAQDGQKFLAIFMLLFSFQKPILEQSISPPFFLVLFCSVFIGLGTLFGGKRIIQSVGFDLVSLDANQGLSSDIAAAIGLVFSTAFGMPVSTTHVKTMSVVGAGIAKDKNEVNMNLVKDMVLTWLLTFPGCLFLGYLITRLLIRFS